MIWKIVFGSLVTLALSVGGWTAQRVATMSDRHPDKSAFEKHCEKSDEKFDSIQKEIQRQRESIEEKLDDIQKELRK